MQCMRNSGPLKIEGAKQLAREMLEALAHIHSSGYMHRDVKAENVLLEPSGRFVLGDCGAAVPILEGCQAFRRCTGTPGFLAPEVLNNRPYNERVDLFSLGAMMHLSICGRRLFPGDSRKDILKANAQCTINLNFHACFHLKTDGLEFLGRLLSKEPSERLSAQDALGHKWLKEGNSERSMTGDGLKDCRPDSGQADNDDANIENLYLTHNSSCYRNADDTEPTKESKGERQSMWSFFRGLLQRRGTRRGITLTKVVPDATSKDHVRPLGSPLDHKSLARNMPGTRSSITSRVSGLAAWVRSRSKQGGSASTDADITAQVAPVRVH